MEVEHRGGLVLVCRSDLQDVVSACLSLNVRLNATFRHSHQYSAKNAVPCEVVISECANCAGLTRAFSGIEA